MNVLNAVSSMLLIFATIMSFYVWPIALLGKSNSQDINVLFDFIKDYQDLISGVIAVIAAYIAGRPVWKQLKANQLQAAASSREVLIQILHEVQKDKSECLSVLDSITSDFLKAICPSYYHDCETATFDIDGHWAHHAEHKVYKALDFIESLLQKISYRPESNESIGSILDKIRTLKECLENIVLEAQFDFSYFDEDFTQEEFLERQKQVKLQAEQSRSEIIGFIGEIDNRKYGVKMSFEADILTIRRRINLMDEELLSLN